MWRGRGYCRRLRARLHRSPVKGRSAGAGALPLLVLLSDLSLASRFRLALFVARLLIILMRPGGLQSSVLLQLLLEALQRYVEGFPRLHYNLCHKIIHPLRCSNSPGTATSHRVTRRISARRPKALSRQTAPTCRIIIRAACGVVKKNDLGGGREHCSYHSYRFPHRSIINNMSTFPLIAKLRRQIGYLETRRPGGQRPVPHDQAQPEYPVPKRFVFVRRHIAGDRRLWEPRCVLGEASRSTCQILKQIIKRTKTCPKAPSGRN